MKRSLSIISSILVLLSITFEGSWVQGADGEVDSKCTTNCACCKNGTCGPVGFFDSGNCYDGCIDGYRGARCYRKCTYKCPKCGTDADICESCYDGFYLEATKDCSGVCPSECVSCSSSTVCTKCKEEFYNDQGSTDCKYRKCPVNCICDQNGCNECQAGYFGPSTTCVETCPSNCNTCQSKDLCQSCKAGYYNGKQLDNPKNPTMNKCVHQCRAECTSCLTYNNCTSCMSGSFGLTCQQKCSTGCYSNGCEKETGNCRCGPNFAGADCTKCIPGKYGDSCGNPCPPYCKNKICDQTSGECSQCKAGFFKTKCNDKCPNNCANSCDRSTGICDSCKNNFYGDFCNSSCSLFCNETSVKDGRRCERFTGKCFFGCNVGKFGTKCNDNCSQLCLDNVCEQNTGKCYKGCITQSKEPECEAFTDEQQSVPLEGGGSLAGTITGAVVGAVVLIVFGILAIIFYKRRQAGGKSKEGEVDEPTQNEEHTNGNIRQDKLVSKNVNKKSTSMIDSSPPKPEARHPGNDTRTAPFIPSSSVVDIEEVEVNKTNERNRTNDTYYNIRESPYRIKVDNLLKYVTSGKVDFEAEFKKLNKDLDLTKHCSVAKDPQNLALNRYNGIYPYDHSRVTIQDLPDFFINACYIDGYCKEKEYIASLGPTSKTTSNFSTFWLMVWYKKTDIIVMLTNLRETSGMKCEQYWPEEDTEIEYGDITVKCRSVEEFAEYTVRTCTIIKGRKERQIIQLHFTAWPDKGVPQEVTSLVEFRQRVIAVPKTLGGPIIVHCSAGVGRTGTYIGLDILTQEGKEKGSVDVFDCVNRMRHQRVNMVQTAEQYKFLHKALVHSLSFGCETLTAEEIQRIMYEADDNTFKKIYKTLALEVDMETKDEINAREENRKRFRDKNRRHSNVPCDSSRVRLFLSRTEGKHDYINAVFINSFRTKNLFIATQAPLPKTVEDFLSMVFQQHTCCVVALEDQNAPGKDVGQYLPADNETFTFGNFSVTSSKYETKSQYILKQLTVKDNTKDQKKSVFHFQYKNWQTAMKVPDRAMDFVQFVKEVDKCVTNDPEDNPNIIAHCLNGFERSGLFCVVYKLLEKLEAERQVSVVNVVRKIRTHRPQSITSMEQLKFCYECVSAYLEIYNTYSNFAS